MASELSKLIEEELRVRGYQAEDEEAPHQALMGALRVEARVKEQESHKKLSDIKRIVCIGGGTAVVFLVWILLIANASHDGHHSPPRYHSNSTHPAYPGTHTAAPAEYSPPLANVSSNETNLPASPGGSSQLNATTNMTEGVVANTASPASINRKIDPSPTTSPSPVVASNTTTSQASTQSPPLTPQQDASISNTSQLNGTSTTVALASPAPAAGNNTDVAPQQTAEEASQDSAPLVAANATVNANTTAAGNTTQPPPPSTDEPVPDVPHRDTTETEAASKLDTQPLDTVKPNTTAAGEGAGEKNGKSEIPAKQNVTGADEPTPQETSTASHSGAQQSTDADLVDSKANASIINPTAQPAAGQLSSRSIPAGKTPAGTPVPAKDTATGQVKAPAGASVSAVPEKKATGTGGAGEAAVGPKADGAGPGAGEDAAQQSGEDSKQVDETGMTEEEKKKVEAEIDKEAEAEMEELEGGEDDGEDDAEDSGAGAKGRR